MNTIRAIEVVERTLGDLTALAPGYYANHDEDIDAARQTLNDLREALIEQEAERKAREYRPAWVVPNAPDPYDEYWKTQADERAELDSHVLPVSEVP